MKVIKQGDKNRAECGSCGSLLEFTVNDIMRKDNGPYYGYEPQDYEEHDYRYSVRCPCGESVSVNRISGRMRERVGERKKYKKLSDYDI
jgi:hypothetical protein